LHFISAGTERCARVGGEIGRADAGGEDHHAALGEVALGAAADDGLAHLVHLDRRLDASLDADLLERILHGERVHDGREHAHVIGLRAVHALGGTGHAAKDVAAADHQAELEARVLGGLHLSSHGGDSLGIDPELAGSHQRLARELQEDAFEGGGHEERSLSDVERAAALL
jgi:hypothetical protein